MITLISNIFYSENFIFYDDQTPHDGQTNVPIEIVLYCILTNPEYGDSISFKHLYQSDAGVGNIFCFDQDILENKLLEINADLKNLWGKKSAIIQNSSNFRQNSYGAHSK